MNRSIYIFLYQSLTQQNRILVVITFPGHETDQRVLTKSKFTIVSRRTVSDYLTCFYMFVLEYDWFLIVAVGLVTSQELGQTVYIRGTVIVFHCNFFGCRLGNGTCLLGNHTNTGVYGSFGFDTGSDYRSFCNHQRYGLTLHVGSHQRTVRIIVLQERDQGCSYREYHLRRYIHVIEHSSFVFLCLFTVTTGYILMKEMSFFIQRFVRLCYMIIIFLISCHINNFVCNTRILRICFVDLTIWSFHKSVFINSCIRCQRVDQTDVRSLRSLYRTHSSVMGIVYISNLESGTVSGQTTRSQCGQTSLMSQLTQRVVLIHELRQLRRTEEFFYSSGYRFDVDQRLWRNTLRILCCHSFTNNTLQS